MFEDMKKYGKPKYCKNKKGTICLYRFPWTSEGCETCKFNKKRRITNNFIQFK